MKKILIAFLALLMIAAPALAAVPGPNSDFYVLDQANVLSSSTEDYIIANNDQLYESCGAQIVFVTVDDTDGDAIDDYSNKLFDKWGIGSSKENNGFLVLMAIDDDNYYALPGTGIEKRMSSGTIKMLLDDYLEPDFADRDYDAGARKLFDALFTEICDMYAVYLTPITGTAASNAANTGNSNQPPRETPVDGHEIHSDSESDFPTGLVIAIIVIVLVISLSNRSKRKRRKSSGGTVVIPVPTPPKHKPVIFHTGPRPGTGPRPTITRRSSFGGSTIKRSGGGGFSRGGGIGRSGGGFSRGGGISRSGGGGHSRGGGAGRGR